MKPENEVSRAQADDGQGREPQNRASESGGVLRPLVDIFENAEGITLRADMPGVSKDRLSLRLDGPNLLVEGTIEIAPQGQMQALYADVRSAVYRRSFMLSNELEPDKIDANLKDGVLTVRIPKRAELRPRRIEVRTA